MARTRDDETWHQLREWTKGQTPSERLAAQILIHEGFIDVDPSHPLGGKDSGKDAIATKNGVRFVMAVYFPRGQQSIRQIRKKFQADIAGAASSSASGIAFVTNQELTLAQRAELQALAGPVVVKLFHLERITAILDTPGMAMVREQFLGIETESPPGINLGGFGGTAPGAAGGGGGAMGPGATGGPGGTGGNLSINLDGTPGEAPGAGGGGAGALGDNAVAGGGGKGGEYFATGPIDVGPNTGIHHLEFRVGRGGIEGPSEDTIVNFCTEDGRVVRRLIARGGDPGAPAYVPPPSRTPTNEDLKAGLKVTSILAANVIYPRAGLWSVLDGGWDFYMADTIPLRFPLPLLVEVETGIIEPGTILDLKLVVRSPDGFHVHEQGQALAAHDGLVRRSRFAVALEVSGSQPGVWHVQVMAGPQLIGDFSLEIRVPISQ